MRKCPTCGAVSSDGVQYCVSCGGLLPEPSANERVQRDGASAAAADQTYAPAEPNAQTPAYGSAPYTAPEAAQTDPAAVAAQKKKLGIVMWTVFAVLTALSLALSAVVFFLPFIPGIDALEGLAGELDEISEHIEQLRDEFEGEELAEQLELYLKDQGLEGVKEKDLKSIARLLNKRLFSLSDMIRILKFVDIEGMNRSVDTVLCVIGVSIGLMVLAGVLACVTRNKALAIVYIIFAVFAISIGKLFDIAAAVVVTVCVSKYKAAARQQNLSA